MSHRINRPVGIENNGTANKLHPEDYSFHNWYRFVLSFPPQLVRKYLKKFSLENGDVILDPFCGTGTTLVEAKLGGYIGIGVEANPIAHLASLVKTDFTVNSNILLSDARKIADEALSKIDKHNSVDLRRFGADEEALLVKGSISPLPLHKTLILRDIIFESESEYIKQLLIALASTTVTVSSNLRFRPEVGVIKNKKEDVDVVSKWLEMVQVMVDDLSVVKTKGYPPTHCYLGDSRKLNNILGENTIDAVFTSPPYPNEKDYTRATRLESVLLGFIKDRSQLKELKQGLLRSNTRNVYKGDQDDMYIANNKEINTIADEIERRRIELKKTSGFERLYHKVTKLYFGGMASHLEHLKPFLKQGAMLGYVVGDQASYLRVHIPTGKLLAEIATGLGYEVVGIDLFRTRFATSTKQDMNEEVVILKWGGEHVG